MKTTTLGSATGSDSALARRASSPDAFRRYLAAVLACAVTTALAFPLSHYFNLANIVMLFPLTVLLVAVRLGRGPAVAAAFVSVALFDFFFVPPRYSFTVADAQYLLTFAVMLIVALITGHLTAGLRLQAEAALLKERRTHALYEMARELAGASTLERVAAIVRAFIAEVVQARSALLVARVEGKLDRVGPQDEKWIKADMARFAYQNTACTDIDAPQPVRYLPLTTPAGVRGVLAVAASGTASDPLVEHGELLEAIASLAAIAVERLIYASASEHDDPARLRGILLSTVAQQGSTSMQALSGIADAVISATPPLSGEQRDCAAKIREHAARMQAAYAQLCELAGLRR